MAAAAPDAAMLDVEVLDTGAALDALASEWEALWRRVPDATPFAYPAWLLPWWRQFGTGLPRVATARRDGRLVGVLPMYLLDGYGPRQMLPIGVSMSDECDMLAEPGTPPDPLLAAVAARADGAEAYGLPDVPPHSLLLDAAVPPGWAGGWFEGTACPVFSLPDTVAGLADVLPARTLRKLRMNRNRAERAGGFTVETATPDTLDASMAALIRLHQSRWTAQNQPGTFADPLAAAFHAEAAPALLAAGLLRLRVLRVQGVAAAACYALLTGHGRILFYLSGFDAAFAAISPGTLLLADMLEQAIREGRREANFLRGNEAYKYAWGGVDRHNKAGRFTRAR